MFLYFLFIRIAALFGHKKARALVQGQKQTMTDETLKQIADLRGAVWFHAASVGEFEQARPIIERLAAQQRQTPHHPKRPIVVTFFSPSGYEVRKNYALADGVFYLPFATRRNAKRFLDALQPKMAIFIKYEFWPAYVLELKKRSVPAYSISAIFRPGQIFFTWYGKKQLSLLKCFTHIYVQDEASLQLLKSHGVEQSSVAGDTRFDRVMDVKSGLNEDDPRLIPVALFAEGCERVIVAGSTWPKDEALLARYMSSDLRQATKLILAPHEIDEAHLHYIFNLFQGQALRYTTIASLPPLAQQNAILHARILLIDTVGLLSSIYRFGQTAYIGGGFGVGIHNTIEAAVYGVPVIFGPNYRHFREAKRLIEVGAARSIKNYKEIESALETALDQHHEIGIKAAEYVQSEIGATERIYKEIFNN